MKKSDWILYWSSIVLISLVIGWNFSLYPKPVSPLKLEYSKPIEKTISIPLDDSISTNIIYASNFAGIRSTSQYRRSMELYRKSHSICEWCQNKDIEVHHIIPVHINTNIAADTNNMVALCRNCHFVIGHACNWNRKWVVNLKEIMVIRKISEDKKLK